MHAFLFVTIEFREKLACETVTIYIPLYIHLYPIQTFGYIRLEGGGRGRIGEREL